MSEFEVKTYPVIIERHPDADLLELARIGDYYSIVLKGQFQTGDTCAYIPEASIVPDSLIAKMGLEGKLAELTVDASTRGRRGRGTGWRQQGKVEGRDPSSAGLGGQGKVRKKSLAYIMDAWRTKPAQKENHVEGAAP